jgi:hypothetical protein
MNEVESIFAIAIGTGILLALFGLAILVFVDDRGGGKWRH